MTLLLLSFPTLEAFLCWHSLSNPTGKGWPSSLLTQEKCLSCLSVFHWSFGVGKSVWTCFRYITVQDMISGVV